MEKEEKRVSEREALQRQSGFHNFITRKILEIVFIIFWFCLKTKNQKKLTQRTILTEESELKQIET